MTWTTLSYAYGSTLTSAKMTQLYDNFAAFGNKDAGAPTLAASYVNQTMIAASSVGQGELKKTTNTLSGQTTSGYSVLASGRYTFMGTTSVTGGINADLDYIPCVLDVTYSGGYSFDHFDIGAGASEAVRFYYYFNIDSGGTGYIRHIYVNASPPHNPFGLGDQSLFIYALVDKNGNIECTWLASDPPWVHNGPTDVTPSTFIKGVGYRKEIIKPPGFDGEDIKLMTPSRRIEYAAAIKDIEPVYSPITEELKHSDMDIVPHPWIYNDLVDKTVVLLAGNIIDDLMKVEESGEEVIDVCQLGYLDINNTQINGVTKTPAGVLLADATWKNT